MPPNAMRASAIVVPRSVIANPAQTAERSWSKRFEI